MFTNDLSYVHPRTRKFYFCGRANDVIICTSCESVLANKVDRVVAGACDCAVFALPDKKYGEAVCAAIVLAEGILPVTPAAAPSPTSMDGIDEITEDAQWTKMIRRYRAERQLAGFKRLRRVFRMHRALPRNSSGKVLKHEIIRLRASRSKEASRLSREVY